jgi:hypothetical protein
MKTVLRIGLCCLLYGGLCGGLMAQRGPGHGGGGGGFRGGGSVGAVRGGGGISGGYRGGYGGYRSGGYGYGRGFYRGYGVYGGWGWPGYLGWGYDPYWGYWDDPYAYAPSYSYPYEYNISPNVSVIYPAAPQTQPVYSAPAQPAMRTYDQYGQEVQPGPAPTGSPIYLIATKDQAIRAAASYWVDGRTLHYVTLQHEEKQIPLDSVDRSLTMQLNRERRVAFQLPQ